MDQVCRIAGVVAGLDTGDRDGGEGECDAQPPATRLQRTLAGPSEPQPLNLPEGWEEAEAEGEASFDGQSYPMGCYFGPHGEVASSVEEMWSMHSEASNNAVAQAEAAQLREDANTAGPSGRPLQTVPQLRLPLQAATHSSLEESVARNLACLGNLRPRH